MDPHLKWALDGCRKQNPQKAMLISTITLQILHLLFFTIMTTEYRGTVIWNSNNKLENLNGNMVTNMGNGNVLLEHLHLPNHTPFKM
jgi:hypothetical protein